MGKFKQLKDTPPADPNGMTEKDHVKLALIMWSAMEKAGGNSGQIPEPLPTDFDQAPDVWLNRYQRKRRPDEQPMRVKGGGTIDPYVARLKTTIAMFLRETPENRMFITGAIEDGVEYRGDRIKVFQDSYNETMKMREIGVEDYRNQSLANMQRKLGITLPGWKLIDGEYRRL